MVENNECGVAGEDERSGELKAINFNDIKGDKPFDISQEWFKDLVTKIEMN